jgi:hypothetical protein
MMCISSIDFGLRGKCEAKDWSTILQLDAHCGPIASICAVRLRKIVTARASSLAAVSISGFMSKLERSPSIIHEAQLDLGYCQICPVFVVALGLTSGELFKYRITRSTSDVLRSTITV